MTTHCPLYDCVPNPLPMQVQKHVNNSDTRVKALKYRRLWNILLEFGSEYVYTEMSYFRLDIHRKENKDPIKTLYVNSFF